MRAYIYQLCVLSWA